MLLGQGRERRREWSFLWAFNCIRYLRALFCCPLCKGVAQLKNVSDSKVRQNKVCECVGTRVVVGDACHDGGISHFFPFLF